MVDVRSAMGKGAAWMLLARIADRALGFVSMLVLARLLAPADFGVVAMAMSFIALLELLTAFGFETTIIQKQSLSRDRLDTAWTYGVIFALLVALLIALFCEQIAVFFSEPALADVLRILALGFVAQGFQNIGCVEFRVNMQFDREFQFMVGKKLIGFVVVLPLAWWTRSYWALVFAQVASRAGGALLSYAMHAYRPKLSLAASGELFNFSKWLLASSWIGYLSERSPDWILGRLHGPGAVGLFNLATELARLSSTEISAPINRAVFSGYARLQDDLARLRHEYLSVMSMVALLACPAALGVGAIADLLVPTLLGDKWLGVIPVLQLLSFYGLISVLQGNAGALYLATGRPKLAVKLGATYVAMQIATMVPLTMSYGPLGTAAAYVLTTALWLPVYFSTVRRVIQARWSEMLGAIWRPVAAALAMYGVVQWAVGEFARLHARGVLGAAYGALAASVLIGVVTYCGAVLALWRMQGKPEGAEAVALRKLAARMHQSGVQRSA